jgi:hypothetical protein
MAVGPARGAARVCSTVEAQPPRARHGHGCFLDVGMRYLLDARCAFRRSSESSYHPFKLNELNVPRSIGYTPDTRLTITWVRCDGRVEFPAQETKQQMPFSAVDPTALARSPTTRILLCTVLSSDQ